MPPQFLVVFSLTPPQMGLSCCLTMATIVPKTIRGHRYYYLVQTAWVNGRSRYVKQLYLGKAEDIGKLFEEATAPDRKSTRLNSSHGYISYAVFCLKKNHARRALLHRRGHLRDHQVHHRRDDVHHPRQGHPHVDLDLGHARDHRAAADGRHEQDVT